MPGIFQSAEAVSGAVSCCFRLAVDSPDCVYAFTSTGNQDALLMRIINGICLYLALVWFLLFQYLFPF